MKPSPETRDAAFDRLVAEALQTQPMPAGAESPVLERLKTIEEYLRASVAPVSQPALIYRDDAAATRALPILEKVTVGRDAACDLAFPDKRTFSRRHFSVGREDGFFVLRDHGSRNGTFINGQADAIAEHVLRDGDIISAGGRLFVFSSGSQDVVSASP